MSEPRRSLIIRCATPVVALALIAFTYGMARYPSISKHEEMALAARFKFDQMALPEVPNHPAYQQVYAVHPSLKRICCWISSLGTAATMEDLDGDGLPNDLTYSDPRTKLVTVAPVPGTGERYAPFTLNPSPLPYADATTAAMGVAAGDFNEDGLMDLMVYYWGRTPVMFLRRKTAGIEPGKRADLSAADYAPCELSGHGERWFSNGAVQADLDGDGHVDVLIGNYFADGARILDANADGVEAMHTGFSKALSGGKKHFLLWTGATSGENPTVTFREVTGVVSPEVNHGWTLALGAADLDGDQRPEIYMSHDFGPTASCTTDPPPAT